MKILNRTDTEALSASFNSDPIHLEHMDGFSVAASWTDTTAGNDTAVSGVLEVQTLTFDTKANSGHQDFVVVADQAGLEYGVYLNKHAVEVQTLTFPDKATAANGDYIVVEDTVGVQYAVALTKPVAEVQTLTYAALAGTTDGDFVIVEDTAGVKYALAADTTGGALVTPAGALWTAADHKALVDISSGTDAASVAALMEIGWNALTGFTAAITTDDTAANGTMTLTQVIKAPVVNPVPKNFDESGAGSITGVETTAGVAAQTPTGAAWTAATYKGLADISGDTTAAQVAARAETAFNALTGFTAAITSDDTAANGTMTLTQVIEGPVDNPVPKDFNDAGAGTITGVQTTEGFTDAAPSGAIWTALNAARKGEADISADTTAAQVAARVETALNALTGFTAAITSDDTAANGTMTLTQTIRGPVTNPVPKNAAETGAGSIAGVETTAGVTAKVNPTTDTIELGAHGFHDGLKFQLTTTGVLPAGLSLVTDYYAIVVDADNIQVASSLSNALAGTEIDITDFGTGTHTAVVQDDLTGTLKLQASNDAFLQDGWNNEENTSATWIDITGSSVAVSGTGSQIWNVSDVYYSAARVVWTRTVGIGTYTAHITAKGAI